MGKLDIGAANYPYCFYNPVRVILEALLKLGVNGKHGRRAIRVPGVNAHCIHVLNKAYGNHLVLGIAHNFQFQLFPAQN